MSCCQLIITITISHNGESSFQKQLLIVILNIIIKNMENSLQNGCLVSFKTCTILQSHSFELVTIVMVINAVISGFSVEDLK